MLESLADALRLLLGLDRDVQDVNALQMALRAILIYAFTLAIVRLGSKRFLGKATAFDVLIAIMLGSVMSRAINGNGPLVPTLAAGAVLVGSHWLIAAIAERTRFGYLVKGNPVLLIEDGKIQEEALRKSNLTQHDLLEALRLRAQETDPSKIRLAYLERNGSISFIPY